MTKERPTKVLVIDDDHGHLTTLKTIISSWGYAVETGDDGQVAVSKVRSNPFDLVLMDVRMAKMSGLEALEQIKNYNPSIPVIIMTAYSSVDSAVNALKNGAYDYLIKPLDFEVLKLSIERASEHAGLKAENQLLKKQMKIDVGINNIIGKSPAMKELMDMVTMVAPSDATVLITGESGTGKELIAKALHYGSSRKKHRLVILNCAAITETLLESELFGHEKGAFTGADKRREGRFMLANHGTIFLDEIGEISVTMQAKLLRVLQEKEIQRVGGDEVLHVDVRIVAATNRDLESEVKQGRFREDLFYRLNVMALPVPPLRRRQDDIPLLAHHFLKKYGEQNRKSTKGYAPLAMDMLLKYHWPGNVRELENTVERAVVLMTGDHVTEKQLPLSITQKYTDKEIFSVSLPLVTEGHRSLEEIEKEAILTTLKTTDGNKSETARRLGITRKTLHNKLKNYGV